MEINGRLVKSKTQKKPEDDKTPFQKNQIYILSQISLFSSIYQIHWKHY